MTPVRQRDRAEAIRVERGHAFQPVALAPGSRGVRSITDRSPAVSRRTWPKRGRSSPSTKALDRMPKRVSRGEDRALRMASRGRIQSPIPHRRLKASTELVADAGIEGRALRRTTIRAHEFMPRREGLTLQPDPAPGRGVKERQRSGVKHRPRHRLPQSTRRQIVSRVDHLSDQRMSALGEVDADPVRCAAP